MCKSIPLPMVLVVLLLVPARAAFAQEPDEAVLRSALNTLVDDDRKKCAKALAVLANSTNEKVRKRVADFGATTDHRQLTIQVGDILATHDPETVKDQFTRLLAKYKKRSDYLSRVAMMAERIPGDPGIELLVGLLKHPNDIVAATAARALGARKAESARGRLESLAKSNRHAVAAAAAYGLAALPYDQGTVDLLLARAQSNSKDRVGDSCALALTQIEGAEKLGDKALDGLAKKSQSNAFHAIAKLAIWLAKDPDPEKVLMLMGAKSERLREVGCDIAGLTKVEDPAVQKALLVLGRRERKWRVRVAAWLALSRTGIEHVVGDVRKTIPAKGEHSYWAIQVAGRNPHEELVDPLRQAALDTKDPVKRDLAQRALRYQPQMEQTRQHFIDQAKKNRGNPKGAAALLAIGNLKDKDAFHALVGMLRTEDAKSVKLQIVKGLEKLTGHFYPPEVDVWMQWYDTVGGEVVYEPEPIDRKKNRERIKDIKKLGISPKTEAAVEAGLLWFSRHQDASGGWNGSTFHEHCPRGDCGDQGGQRERPLAYTALALLAYQGAGYTHEEGPYRDVMRRGFEYLLAEMDYDGSHYENNWTFSYEAALVCQALCDGYALTGDPWIGVGAQRMIDYVTKIQHPGETWRYQVRDRSTDTSVMSWILMACVSGQHAGLHVPDQIYVCCSWWLDRSTEPLPNDETFEIFNPDHFKEETYGVDISRDKYGRKRKYKMKMWYIPPQLYTPAMPAIGILSRIWMGWTRAHPACIGYANQLSESIPGYGTGLEKEVGFYPYTWYYGSLAMYQMGGRYWSDWRKICVNDIINHQEQKGHLRGSWKMPREQYFSGLTGGPMYCTAMCILTLETFYRYQPYLTRAKIRGSKEPEKPPDDQPDDPKEPQEPGGESQPPGGKGGGGGGDK
ncbi:MAG: HEAT repeat domain-containing protein [Planctomycetota bacterium]|jgi:HEAT repeat protein